MTLEAIQEDLRQYNGGKGFISQNKLRSWYGQNFKKLQEMLNGLDYMKDGNKKLYFIGDVAEAVMQRAER